MSFVIRQPEKSGKKATVGAELKLCPCGRTFTPYRPYQVYCTSACKDKYGAAGGRYQKKPTMTVTCKQCGKEFQTNDGKRRYCCQECYDLAQIARRTKATQRVCPICGKTFESSHWSKTYCSGRCRFEARRREQDARG